MNNEQVKGWWSFGNGGYRMVEEVSGTYPVSFAPENPEVFLNQLPFVMIPMDALEEDKRDLSAYGDPRDQSVNGVMYRCWYKKRLSFIDGAKCAHLDDTERQHILQVTEILYRSVVYGSVATDDPSDKASERSWPHAVISELILYHEDGSFRCRLRGVFIPLSYFNQFVFHFEQN